MKQFISRLLIVLLLAFFFVTNPTTEEFASWYAEESFSTFSSFSAFPMSDRIEGAYAQHLERGTDRNDYLFCSIYHYNGSMILGIAHRFYPLDELNTQIETLRADFNTWAEANAH